MGKKPQRKKFRIIEEDLTDSDDWGQTNKTGSNSYEITIDKNHETERDRLDTLVHEALHVADWYMSERKVVSLAKIVTDALWRQGYRRRVKWNRLMNPTTR